MGAQDRATVEDELATAEVRAAPTGPVPSLPFTHSALALQRLAGNRAVGAWLARATRADRAALQRAFSDARRGGWNAGDVSVAATLRIPLEGIGLGNASADNPVTKKLTDGTVQTVCTESARERAIVIVPDAVSLGSGTVEVMLHFHGVNIGGRERKIEQTVRDVEVDQIPQQLVASGRNIVAVLPQGPSGTSDAARFNISDPRAYVNAVLGQATSHLAGRLGTAGTLQAGRIVVTGHSGGGAATVAAAAALQPAAGAVLSDDDWAMSSPLILFDAVNSPAELTKATNLVKQMLATDLAKLQAAGANGAALLSRRGLKFRSTYGTGSWDGYAATNVGGSAHDTKTGTVTFTVAPKDSLKGVIDKWFADNAASLGANATGLRAQYLVERVSGVHDYNVGTGAAAGKRGGVPSGVTAPGSAGVPDYAGGGHLQDSLAQLSANPIPSSASPTAQGAPPSDTSLVITPPPPERADAEDLDAGTSESEFDENGERLPGGKRLLTRAAAGPASDRRWLARDEDVPAKLTAAAVARGRSGATPEAGKSLLTADYIRDAIAARDSNATVKRAFDYHVALVQSATEGTQRDERNRNEAGLLIVELEDEFVHNPAKSSVDLLPPDRAAHYRGITWGQNDYPGNGGPQSGEAAAMANELAVIDPQRRPNAGSTAVIAEAERDANLAHLIANLKAVDDQPGHQLFAEGADQFAYMAAIAALDGVELKILSSWRDPAVARANAARAGNSAAVAAFSSHSLGLAVDVQMSGGSQHFSEIQTHPMSNVFAMRSSPVHKWLVFHAAWFGWYPYGNEPWHWEYNPPGFRDRYRAAVIPTRATPPATGVPAAPVPTPPPSV